MQEHKYAVLSEAEDTKQCFQAFPSTMALVQFSSSLMDSNLAFWWENWRNWQKNTYLALLWSKTGVDFPIGQLEILYKNPSLSLSGAKMETQTVILPGPSLCPT